MSFRKLQVDKYDEDGALLEKEEILEMFKVQVNLDESLSKYQNLKKEVAELLVRGNVRPALLKILSNPPYGIPSKGVQDLVLQTIMEILAVTKPNDIAASLNEMSSEQQDLLMKYLYKGMASPSLYNSAVLLAWHEKLTEVAGHGCILRVLTDRRLAV